MNRAVTGATSNPTTFAQAIVGSDRYDAQLGALLEAGVGDPREQFLELAVEDVRHAAALLQSTHERSRGADGVDAFCDSYSDLLTSIERRVRRLTAPRPLCPTPL